jgi:hypothetical protein
MTRSSGPKPAAQRASVSSTGVWFGDRDCVIWGRFATAGLALLANALWPLILLPLVIVIVRRVIIDREERYLTAKFGEEYLRYKARVRRWL